MTRVHLVGAALLSVVMACLLMVALPHPTATTLVTSDRGTAPPTPVAALGRADVDAGPTFDADRVPEAGTDPGADPDTDRRPPDAARHRADRQPRPPLGRRSRLGARGGHPPHGPAADRRRLRTPRTRRRLPDEPDHPHLARWRSDVALDEAQPDRRLRTRLGDPCRDRVGARPVGQGATLLGEHDSPGLWRRRVQPVDDLQRRRGRDVVEAPRRALDPAVGRRLSRDRGRPRPRQPEPWDRLRRLQLVAERRPRPGVPPPGLGGLRSHVARDGDPATRRAVRPSRVVAHRLPPPAGPGWFGLRHVVPGRHAPLGPCEHLREGRTAERGPPVRRHRQGPLRSRRPDVRPRDRHMSPRRSPRTRSRPGARRPRGRPARSARIRCGSRGSTSIARPVASTSRSGHTAPRRTVDRAARSGSATATTAARPGRSGGCHPRRMSPAAASRASVRTSSRDRATSS